ncbi:MAG: hypothetical protein AAF960_07420, partial [Bacteroidota bacterium]
KKLLFAKIVKDPKNFTIVNELQSLRYKLIDLIMGISDIRRLRSLYREVQPLPSSPEPNIPVTEIRMGVTLEDIKAGQTVKEMNFEEFRKKIEEVEWEESLEELLDSLD